MKFKNVNIAKICLTIKIKFLPRSFLYINFILQLLFQSAQHFNEKWEGSASGSGSVLVTNGSGCGSGRPKNIRIRIRLRIRNTASTILLSSTENVSKLKSTV
jgi:hypothetical protein